MYKYKNLCETNDPVNFKEKIDEKYLSLNSINKMISEKRILLVEIIPLKKFQWQSFPKYFLNNLKTMKSGLIDYKLFSISLTDKNISPFTLSFHSTLLFW